MQKIKSHAQRDAHSAREGEPCKCRAKAPTSRSHLIQRLVVDSRPPSLRGENGRYAVVLVVVPVLLRVCPRPQRAAIEESAEAAAAAEEEECISRIVL